MDNLTIVDSVSFYYHWILANSSLINQKQADTLLRFLPASIESSMRSHISWDLFYPSVCIRKIKRNC